MSSTALLKSEYKNKFQVNKFVYNNLYDNRINYLYSILLTNCTIVMDENNNIQLSVSKNDIISIDQFTDRPLRKTFNNINIENFFELFLNKLPNNFTSDPPNVSLEINGIEQRTVKISILPEDLQKYLNSETDNIIFYLKLLPDQFQFNVNRYDNCTVSLFVDNWGWLFNDIGDALKIFGGAIEAINFGGKVVKIINDTAIITDTDLIIDTMYESTSQYFIQAINTGTIVIGSAGAVLLFTALVDPGEVPVAIYNIIKGMISIASSLSTLTFTVIPKIFSVLYPNSKKLTASIMKEYYKKTSLTSGTGGKNMQVMSLIWVFTLIGYSIDIIVELYNIGLFIYNNELDIQQKAYNIYESLSIIFSMYLYPIWQQTNNTASTMLKDFSSASKDGVLESFTATCHVGELMSKATGDEVGDAIFTILGFIGEAIANSSPPPIEVTMTQVDSSWATLTSSFGSVGNIISINRNLLKNPETIQIGTVLNSSHFNTGPSKFPNSDTNMSLITGSVLSNNYINRQNLIGATSILNNLTTTAISNTSQRILPTNNITIPLPNTTNNSDN